MLIRLATSEDQAQLVALDHHIPPAVIARKITQHEILVAHINAHIIGWLRYSYFWDSIPFMNMLHIQADYRGQGIGTQLVNFWEQRMREQGFREVLTSTLANERGQFLYRKLGYHDCGALLLPDEPLELIMRKSII